MRFRRTNQGNLSARGWRHVSANLGTIRAHRALYHQVLGRRGTMGVVGRVLHDEGCRRGGLGGVPLRVAGGALWLLGGR